MNAVTFKKTSPDKGEEIVLQQQKELFKLPIVISSHDIN